MTLNEEVAVEVMGWEKKRCPMLDVERWCREDEGVEDGILVEPQDWEEEFWAPNESLDHARIVAEKGIGVLEETSGIHDPQLRRETAMHYIVHELRKMEVGKISVFWPFTLTAEQICQAVLMAVREARK